MKKMTHHLVPVLLAFPMSLVAVACSGNNEGVTAENITKEECDDLFAEGEAEDTSESEEVDAEETLEGDYDADGDEDEDDDAIEERCEELMAEEDEAADEESEG